MVKVERISAFRIGNETFSNLKDAEREIRTQVIEEVTAMGHKDAELISEQWDEINNKIKEAMRGL